MYCLLLSIRQPIRKVARIDIYNYSQRTGLSIQILHVCRKLTFFMTGFPNQVVLHAMDDHLNIQVQASFYFVTKGGCKLGNSEVSSEFTNTKRGLFLLGKLIWLYWKMYIMFFLNAICPSPFSRKGIYLPRNY